MNHESAWKHSRGFNGAFFKGGGKVGLWRWKRHCNIHTPPVKNIPTFSTTIQHPRFTSSPNTHPSPTHLPVPLHPHPLYAANLLVETKTKDHDSNTLHIWWWYELTIFFLKSCYAWWRLTCHLQTNVNEQKLCVASFVQSRQLHTKQHNPTCDLVAYVITRSTHTFPVCQTPSNFARVMDGWMDGWMDA